MKNVNELPKKIPVFPLSNAIFFPKTILPLNIFEKRYIQMVSESMKGNKLFGMIQLKCFLGFFTRILLLLFSLRDVYMVKFVHNIFLYSTYV